MEKIEILKECPFCGSEAVAENLGKGRPRWWVTCTSSTCGAMLWGYNKHDAIRSWNKRYKK